VGQLFRSHVAQPKLRCSDSGTLEQKVQFPLMTAIGNSGHKELEPASTALAVEGCLQCLGKQQKAHGPPLPPAKAGCWWCCPQQASQGALVSLSWAPCHSKLHAGPHFSLTETYKTTAFAGCEHWPCLGHLLWDKGLAHGFLMEISEVCFPPSPAQEAVGKAHMLLTDLLFHAEEAVSVPTRILL